MAVKRVKKDAVHELYTVSDDAIDKDKSDVKAYSKDMDVRHLTFKDGEHPTIFLVKNIGSLEKAALQEDHYKLVEKEGDKTGDQSIVKAVNTGQMMIKYFRACITQVKEWDSETSAYVVQEITVDDFPYSVSSELGAYAFRKSQLGDVEKKS